MLLVAQVEAGFIQIEGVAVLHDELPYTQQPGFWSRLVTKLGLDLVPDLRKLLVAGQLLARDIGHDLFVGHAQAEPRTLAVLQPKHVLAHARPAPTLLPQFAWMDRRQQKLLPDLVHLLANDSHDLVDRPLTEEQVGVDARAKLADISAPNEELVTGDFGVRRSLTKGRDKEPGPAMHRARGVFPAADHPAALGWSSYRLYSKRFEERAGAALHMSRLAARLTTLGSAYELCLNCNHSLVQLLAMLNAFIRFGDGQVVHANEVDKIASAFHDPSAQFWLDIAAPDDSEHALLVDVFGFHPLVVEDVVHEIQRPKLESYAMVGDKLKNEYFFLVIHGPETDPDPERLFQTTELDAIFSERYLITIHEAPLGSLNEMF